MESLQSMPMANEKIAPELNTPPAEVIPYRVDPTSVGASVGSAPSVPVKLWRTVYPLPVLLILKITPFPVLPPAAVMP